MFWLLKAKQQNLSVCPSRLNFTLRLQLVTYIVTSTNRLRESTTCNVAVSPKKTKTIALQTIEKVAFVAISLQLQRTQQTNYDCFPQNTFKYQPKGTDGGKDCKVRTDFTVCAVKCRRTRFFTILSIGVVLNAAHIPQSPRHW